MAATHQMNARARNISGRGVAVLLPAVRPVSTSLRAGAAGLANRRHLLGGGTNETGLRRGAAPPNAGG